MTPAVAVFSSVVIPVVTTVLNVEKGVAILM